MNGFAEEPRKRRHKWGPPAAGEFANASEQKPKKRRSRWEDSTELIVPTAKSGAVIIPGQIPREVTICGGAVKVCALHSTTHLLFCIHHGMHGSHKLP